MAKESSPGQMQNSVASLAAQSALSHPKMRTLRIFYASVVMLWVALVSYGIGALLIYGVKPGEPACAPRILPIGTSGALLKGMPLMMVFLHPHCPCSRTTVEQLPNILIASRGAIECHVVLVIPPDTEPGWENGSLLRLVNSIPGLKVQCDRGGLEAKRFAVATSGQVLFYKGDRTLAFCGGITASRGHAGDSIGLQTIMTLLRDEETKHSHTPVYGCPLLKSETFCGEKSQCQR